jgi:FkbM family methyltransferase
VNQVWKSLKRLRENYYLSRTLSAGTKPLYAAFAGTASQVLRKVKRNGVRVLLPNGKELKIARDSGVSLATSLFWHGIDGFEPETSKTLRFFFERSNTFLDVGANYGTYTLLAALWNSSLRVVAFEPLPQIFQGLLRNVALNQLELRVVCENIALSDRSGASTLYLPDSESKDVESTGTLSTDSWQVRKNSRPVHIEAVRFDEYEAHHPMHVDLIKIDVEDFEASVLEGMSGVVRRDHPFIVCEILPRNREHRNEKTKQVIESLGYTAYWITTAGYIRVSRFDFERGFTNFLLSPVSVPNEILDSPAILWELKQKTWPSA